MSAKEELIAAALTACGVFELSAQFENEKNAVETLREACARAMVQPDIAEVERLVSALTAGAHDSMTLGDYTDEEAARSALLDYVRDHFGDADKMVQPVGEVPMPESDGFMSWQSESGGPPRVVEVVATERVRTYGDAREAAGYTAGVASGAKQMFDYMQFAAANTTDTEWDMWLCELSQNALEAVYPEAHVEWKTIQQVASESRTAGKAAGYARGLAEAWSRVMTSSLPQSSDEAHIKKLALQAIKKLALQAIDAALRGEVKP